MICGNLAFGMGAWGVNQSDSSMEISIHYFGDRFRDWFRIGLENVWGMFQGWVQGLIFSGMIWGLV